MMAYEGIRRMHSCRHRTVAYGADAAGQFLGGQRPLRNPRTGLLYPGNIIPASDLSPIALRILQEYYTAPNRRPRRQPGGQHPFERQPGQILFRVDQNIGTCPVYFRYNGRMTMSTTSASFRLRR